MTVDKRLSENWSLSFVTVSDQFWDALLRFAKGLLRNADDAEDIVQMALVKALKGFPRFCQLKLEIATPEEATRRFASEAALSDYLRNWLYKIVRHTSYDESESRAEFVEIDEDSSQLSAAEQTYLIPENILKFEDQFYKHALDDEWYKRLECLTSKQRTVLFLAAEGHAYREIADLLEVPIGTVMSNLARALAKLKK